MITTAAAAASTCTRGLTWPDVVTICVAIAAAAVVILAIFR